MCRKEATVLAPFKVFPFEMLVEAIVRLQRFYFNCFGRKR